MKPSLKAKLAAAIDAFLDEVAEHDDRPAGFVHPEMGDQMTNAAEAVFDATFASSRYTESEVQP